MKLNYTIFIVPIIFYVYIFTPERGYCDIKIISEKKLGRKTSARMLVETCSDGAFTTTSMLRIYIINDENAEYEEVYSEEYYRNGSEPEISYNENELIISNYGEHLRVYRLND